MVYIRVVHNGRDVYEFSAYNDEVDEFIKRVTKSKPRVEKIFDAQIRKTWVEVYEDVDHTQDVFVCTIV